jgi:hypothetical protein
MANHTQSNDDYNALTAALEKYTSLSNRSAEIEANFNGAIQELIAEFYKDDFQALQADLAETEARIETLVIRHPEWFAKSKTLKTPFGSVATRSTTKIDVPNEDATIALLELRGEAAKPFLRERKLLSIESLEALDDAELLRLKVRRITTEKITISPAKVDLGKTLKKSTEPAPV